MQKDNVNNTTTKVGFGTQTISDGTTAGAIIDTLGYESGKFSLIAGAVTAGDVTFVSIEESNDSGMSGSTLIPAHRLIAVDVTPLTAVNQVAETGFVSVKRYVRMSVIGANGADLIATATCELGDPVVASTKG